MFQHFCLVFRFNVTMNDRLAFFGLFGEYVKTFTTLLKLYSKRQYVVSEEA